MRLVLILCLVTSVFCATSQEWKSRSIYQVLTDRFAKSTSGTARCLDLNDYCGGSYKALTKKLDYIKDMGFNAIWISPIPHNFPKGYHGYWADDLTRMNEHFGTEKELLELVKRAHLKDIWVMVDVVGNHMFHDFIDQIIPFNKSEHYHSCDVCPRSCQIEDWSNQQQVEDCKLSNMPDLNQTHPYVRDTLKSWVKDVVDKYKFDGIRIDTVLEVPKWFWGEYVQSAGVFAMGEVANSDLSYVSGYQSPLGTMPSVLSYPLYYTMVNVFAYGHSMYELRDSFNAYVKSFGDVDVLGTFLDCHDQPRFLSFNRDHKLYENGLVTVMLSSGIPVVYYGTEQYFDGGHDPWNREDMWRSDYNTKSDMYKYIKALNWARDRGQVWKYMQVERYVDDHFYAFTRGQVLVATTNVGSGGPKIERHITYHPYREGDRLCNIFWPTDCITVWQNELQVVLNSGEAKVYLLT
ncbi:hypothetical protein PROFUN_01993 [Planoprotostelium fungivorum]|uniref:alpha-amylase n=1 Tax=Planoprotostelium fungivorum TaxID=1890364 RepID=A0A2P6NB46_9EUKA|nr:hypothetical protein PROFUN_01993 [Planoprotostelium fungivorum]